MRALLISLVLLVSPVALADDAVQQVKVPLNGSTLLHLPSVASVGVCDDPSIVKVEDAGDALRLVGLKVGKTRCGFWLNASPGQHTLVDVTVEAPPAKP